MVLRTTARFSSSDIAPRYLALSVAMLSRSAKPTPNRHGLDFQSCQSVFEN